MIDDITDAFGPLIQSIEYEVDSIDELVLILKDAEQSDMLRRYLYPSCPFSLSATELTSFLGLGLAEKKSWASYD